MPKGKFKDKKDLNRLMVLLEEGLAYKRIAVILQCDKTTVRYYARKYGIGKNIKPRLIIENLSSGAIASIEQFDRDSRSNWGKSYAQYLKEDKDRRFNQLLNNGKRKEKGK